MQKYCIKCCTTKPLDEFNKASQSKDGHYTYCRKCVRAYIKQKGYATYQYRGPEQQRQAMRSYRKTTKNKEYEASYRKAYLKSFDGKASKLLSSSKHRAKRKNIEHTLTLSWVKEHLAPMVCAASGIPFTFHIEEDRTRAPFSPSIDRVDSSKGYTQDNCQIVCLIYNVAKGEGNHSDVMTLAKALLAKSK